MGEGTEKFIIDITDTGVVILNDQKKRLEFTAGEALMLLDILKNEESRLREIAGNASPLPIQIQF